MIQIITYDKHKFSNFPDDYKVSNLDEFNSFDDYNINIIDLSSENIWRYRGHNIGSINNVSDLETLSNELNMVKKSRIIIVFPQNCNYKYSWSDGKSAYNYTEKIKNILLFLIKLISSNLFVINNFEISYSKSQTVINDCTYNSDFNFVDKGEKSFVTISNSVNSNKNTTIIYNNLILTTLNIFETNDHLNNFLSPLLVDKSIEIEQPEWMDEINFFDDEKLKENKNNNNEKIIKLQNKNREIDVKLAENSKFKSILYQTGEELQTIIIDMLDDMLNYDSSQFIDEKKEDFLIKKQQVTFVGEIKGISSAISNKNVSQLDVHVQGYIDELLNKNITENVKGLLIINHQRNKKPSERNEVHQNQIDLAIRNGALIIESNILLLVYEKYLLGELKSEDIVKLFSCKIGILKKEDLK